MVAKRSSDTSQIDQVGKEFVHALEADDFESQYELLTRGTNDLEVAGELLEATQDLISTKQPRPIEWEAIRRRLQHTRMPHRVLEVITSPGIATGRTWTAILATLTMASAAALALLIRGAMELPTSDSAFRGSIFLAMVCLGLMVLSTIALITTPLPQNLRARSRMGAVPVLAAILQTSIVGVAAAAIIVLALFRGVAPPVLSGLGVRQLQAVVSPTAPATFVLSSKEWNVLTASASNPKAEIVLVFVDDSGKEVKRAIGTEMVQVRLPKHERQTVTKIEVTSNMSTTVAIAAGPPALQRLQ